MTSSQAPITLDKVLRIEKNKFKRRSSDNGCVRTPEELKEVEIHPLVPAPSLTSSEQHRDDVISRNDLVHRHLNHLHQHNDGSDTVVQSGKIHPPPADPPVEEQDSVSPSHGDVTTIGKSSSPFWGDLDTLGRFKLYGLFALLAIACVALLPSSLQNDFGDAQGSNNMVVS